MSTPDAGPMSMPDASTMADAGTPEDSGAPDATMDSGNTGGGAPADDGCGCAVPGARKSSPSSALLLVVLFGLALVIRRRGV